MPPVWRESRAGPRNSSWHGQEDTPVVGLEHHTVPALVNKPQDYGPTDLTRARTLTCRNCGGGDRGHVAIYRPFVEVSLSLNRTVTCRVLKANDRRSLCPCHDELVAPLRLRPDRWH
ncbi:uncharacterized protein TNCV_504621 [Trichonephila clavipes]|nr:uncharacterized protein TNCV_504621 [Trichonephila clavipes]